MIDPSTDEVNDYILRELPATFQSLVQRKLSQGQDWYRPIDRGLQRLRKKGVISFRREGRATVWSSLESKP